MGYLAKLTWPRFVLWCYFLWWVGAAVPYFDPSPSLWGTSFGMSAVIGTGLYLSTAYGGARRTSVPGWGIFRLYAMPFFVSSFVALTKGRGFVLIFHPNAFGNLAPVAVMAVLGALWAGARYRAKAVQGAGGVNSAVSA
jgi:hypothetical protein